MIECRVAAFLEGDWGIDVRAGEQFEVSDEARGGDEVDVERGGAVRGLSDDVVF